MKMIKVPRPPSPRRTPRRVLRPMQARTAAREEDFEEYDAQAEPSMKLSHAFFVVLVLHVLAVGGVFAFNTLKTTQTASGKKAAAAETKSVEKAAEPAAAPPAAPATAAAAPAAAATKPTAKPVDSSADSHTVAAGDTLTRIASQHKTTVEAIEQANDLEPMATIRVGQVLKIPSKPAPATAKPVVAKEAPSKPAATPAVVSAKPAAAPAVASAKPAAPPAAKPAVAAAPPATEAPAAKPAAAGTTYTVAKGDNPYSIAKKLKVSYNELIKANKIEDPTKLQIGQQLIVP